MSADLYAFLEKDDDKGKQAVNAALMALKRDGAIRQAGRRQPYTRGSLRQPLSWLAWTPSSWATACRVLPLSASRLTASLLYSAVNRRRFLVSILRSRCWWAPPYGGVHPAGAGSDRVRPLGREVLVEQVGGDREVVPAVGRPRRPSAAPAGGEPHLAHEPRHPLATDPDALLAQLGVHARAAVGPSARGEDRPDPFAHPSIVLSASPRPAAQP